MKLRIWEKIVHAICLFFFPQDLRFPAVEVPSGVAFRRSEPAAGVLNHRHSAPHVSQNSQPSPGLAEWRSRETQAGMANNAISFIVLGKKISVQGHL